MIPWLRRQQEKWAKQLGARAEGTDDDVSDEVPVETLLALDVSNCINTKPIAVSLLIRVFKSVLKSQQKVRQSSNITDTHRKHMEETAMLSTNIGKAILFVMRLKRVMKKFQSTRGDWMEMLATDDLVLLVERMLNTQDRFIGEGKPYFVDIGYHYTKPENIPQIMTEGLLNKKERLEKQVISVKSNGNFLGDGIYTANNPTSFKTYGEVGLIVGRLPGRVLRVSSKRFDLDPFVDTLVGNKKLTPSPTEKDEIVLRTSSQVLPLIMYPKSEMRTEILECQKAIGQMLDEFFTSAVANAIKVCGCQTTSLSRKLEKAERGKRKKKAGQATALSKKLEKIESRQRKKNQVAIYNYESPANLSVGIGQLYSISSRVDEGPREPCPICLMPMEGTSRSSTRICRVNKCGHMFHCLCLINVLYKSQASCPVCRSWFQEPQGSSPSGTMTIAREANMLCDGHSVIRIIYAIPDGIQKEYHESPRIFYHGDWRVAYLPDNDQGNALLQRLIYAFLHGLTFLVGTPWTTGKTNCIRWSTIPHKTCLSGGTNGFPDPLYFVRANEELNQLGVPTSPDNRRPDFEKRRV